MRPQSVLVLHDGSMCADGMLRLACNIVGPHGRVIVLAITQVHPTLPLSNLPAYFDEPSLRALRHVWEMVHQYDAQIEPRLRRTHDAGKTILQEAEGSDVDAIFLVIKQPKLFWLPFRLGGTARTVLRDASCPVLVGRYPPPALAGSDVLEQVQQVLRHHPG